MTRDDIVEIARQVGFRFQRHDTDASESVDKLEMFVKRIIEKERKACSEFVQQLHLQGYSGLYISVAVRTRGVPADD